MKQVLAHFRPAPAHRARAGSYAAAASVVVERSETTARLARHFAESPRYSVEEALAAAERAARRAGR